MPKPLKTNIFYQLSRRLKTPQDVQRFLYTLEYNREKKKETLRSAAEAIKHKTAHCLEGSFVAAAILEHHGYPPLVVSMESIDLLDHVVFVFRHKGKWGAIGRSREEGLNGRKPIFRSLRALILSYVEPYVDDSGRIKAYQLANLDDCKADWRSSRKNVWKAENYLLEIKHIKLKTSNKKYHELKKRFLDKGPMPRQKHWW